MNLRIERIGNNYNVVNEIDGSIRFTANSETEAKRWIEETKDFVRSCIADYEKNRNRENILFLEDCVRSEPTNEYEEKAYQIMNNLGITIEAYCIGFTFPKWDERKHLTYSYILRNRAGEEYVSFYYESDKKLEDFREGKDDIKISAHSILANLEKYPPNDFWEFTSKYGIGNCRETYEYYRFVKEENSRLNRIFSEEEMKELRKIY